MSHQVVCDASETQFPKRMLFVSRLFFVYCLFISSAVSAQIEILQSNNYSTAHGLSSNYIMSIYQDSQGFMWLGTYDGLNKFDGHRFTVYKADPDDPNSISNNVIYTLLEDDRGYLWIGTSNGVSRYNRHMDCFQRFLPALDDSTAFSGEKIRHIFQDSRGMLWFASWNAGGSPYGGLYRFDYETETFEGFHHDPEDANSLSDNAIRAIAEDEKGRLWVATQRHGLNVFDVESGVVTRLREHGENKKSHSDAVWQMTRGERGELWMTSWGRGLARYDTEHATFEQFLPNPRQNGALNSEFVSGIFRDKMGRIWISNGLLSRYNPATNAFTHFRFS